jgi:hypothetical protein
MTVELIHFHPTIGRKKTAPTFKSPGRGGFSQQGIALQIIGA